MAQKQLHVVTGSGKHNLKYNFKIQEKLGSYGLHCHLLH